jgi:thioredoxin reductase (NADPH)
MNHDTIEILGDEQVVTGVKALNKTTRRNFWYQATGFFAQFGQANATDIFKDFTH